MTYHDKFDRMDCGKRKPPPKSESHVIVLLELLDKIPIAKVGYRYKMKLGLPLTRVDAPVDITVLRYWKNELALWKLRLWLCRNTATLVKTWEITRIRY
jgi:hypothetical protein